MAKSHTPSHILRVALLLFVTVSSYPIAAQKALPGPIVRTDKGNVQGVQEGPLRVFRGIPYAQPPVGNLRFRPPHRLPRWKGVRLTQQFGSRAVQAAGSRTQGKEDCLYLNVWAPAPAKHQRPVVVWVHGGAFTGGSGQENDTWTFAAQDTIVAVSINYRLGSLGFLHVGNQLGPQYAQSGNCGLLDAVAALKWVQQNIAAFGGDPRRVTLMGESAGAKLVGALLVTPAAQGLFKQAILESGAVQAVRDTATAAAVTRQLLAELRIATPTALLTLPADSLIRAQSRFAGGSGGLQVFGPVLDGVTIRERPLEYLQSPRQPIRVLLGTNREEAVLFTGPGSVIAQPSEAALQQVFGARNSPLVWQAYLQASRTQPPLQAWNTTLTDYLYRLATYRLASTLAARQVPVWLYRFDYADAVTRPMHAQELAFVWNAPAGTSASNTVASASAGSKASNAALAALMHGYWARFIKTGQPGTAWPAYTNTSREVLLFDTNSHAEPLLTPYEDPQFPARDIIGSQSTIRQSTTEHHKQGLTLHLQHDTRKFRIVGNQRIPTLRFCWLRAHRNLIL